MKKIIVLVSVLVLALTGCTKEVPVEVEVIKEVEVPVEVEVIREVLVKETFYVELEFEGTGYTPAYNYFLSGTLNDQEEITAIRFDMVSAYGISKRSTEYKMNNAKVQVGGTAGNQTIEIFIGGSSENIGQIYNTIKGDLTDGDMLVLDLNVLGAYPGAVVAFEEEIWGVLADGLGIEINETTTMDAFLGAMGLYNEETGAILNGYKFVALKGYWGGGTYDQQLTALEQYIITNKLTLVEAYELVSTANQGDDNRDTVAGATVFFDPKIQETFMVAAGVVNETETTETTNNAGETVITVEVKGLKDMTVEVTIDEGVIIKIEVTKHDETAAIGGALIEDGEFVQLIIDGQSDLNSIDAEAGATMTSDALIEAAIVALEAYNN